MARKYVEYKGAIYLVCVPAKHLFNSTTIHNVITRGDMLGMNLETSELAILSKNKCTPVKEPSHIPVSMVMAKPDDIIITDAEGVGMVLQMHDGRPQDWQLQNAFRKGAITISTRVKRTIKAAALNQEVKDQITKLDLKRRAA